ncbi:hypothetical protein H310_11096 [Aphanomyces invadans]|uniref:Uncharacterized protein n=1 Tax=Aphanomyces invadans TaxID=157072 RepID=A0A024TNS9_9STRA|nr:hypothetical protein H310_11096 [Aphanomyces invadans]ETV95678.1 hypothetical protein H310_11096 [Aphanomyces invadans]|eukprot:XP_008875871.1 hypothetical protein H310_11096 [Aphanomyces invadans]
MADPKASAAKGKFTRLNRVGVLPDIGLYAPEAKEKSRSVADVHHEFLLNQRQEVEDICTGLQVRLEHVKKVLPVPKTVEGPDDTPSNGCVPSPLEKRIEDAIAAEQEDADAELTPLDHMAIALEVCQDLFPHIGKALHDEAGAQVNVEYTHVLLQMVETIENCVHDKVVRDRIARQTRHEVRSPEKTSVQSSQLLSPTARFKQFRHDQAKAPPSRKIAPSPSHRSAPFELESLLHKEHIGTGPPLPKVHRDNTFRQVLKCRQFPPTKVPKDEAIEKTYSHCPIESRFDMQSVHMAVDEAKHVAGSWIVVEFPKARPSLTSSQVAYLSQWQAARYRNLVAMKGVHDSDVVLHLYLEYTDSVMYEMCRLLFDKCPTSANVLYGLWHFFFTVVAFINKTIEEELTVLQQTVRCLKVEVEQYQSKITKQAAVVDAMRAKLVQKHKAIALAREMCIRQRNELNRYLAADQSLVRLTMSFVQSIHAFFPDKSTTSSTACPPSSRHFSAAEALDEMTRTLALKFASASTTESHLPSASHKHPQRLSTMHHVNSIADDASRMLTHFDVDSMAPELDAAQKRLAQLLTLSSPDCTLGWDAQAVWQHAFFIPPPDEVVEMEYRVRHMILRVERGIAARGCIRRRMHRGVQVDLGTEPSTLALDTSPSHQTTLRSIQLAAGFCRPTPHDATVSLKRHAELKKVVPASFQKYIVRLSAAYVPHDYTVSAVSRVLTYVANTLVGQLAAGVDIHSDMTKACMPKDMAEMESPIEAVYRVFLTRFRVPLFANERVMDLVTSLSHLDTQSDKIYLWCRLLHLAGVDPLPATAFWFVLHVLHVLAKCSHDGYYTSETSDDVEYIGQQSAWDALGIVFASFPTEVFQRCKTKLIGLSQIYGAIWIPIYTIVAMCVDEWEAQYFAVRVEIETRFANALKVDSLHTFHQVVSTYVPRVHAYAAATTFSTAIQMSRSSRPTPADCAAACIQAGLVPPHAAAQFDKLSLLFAIPSDAMTVKTLELSMSFLSVVWTTTKDQLVRAIEDKAADTTVGLRLVTPLDHATQEDPPQVALCWNLLEQVIAIAYCGRTSTSLN